MDVLARSLGTRIAWLIAFLVCGAATPVVHADEEAALLRKVEEAEFDATRALADALSDTALSYLDRAYRKEALHFLKRCVEIRPKNTTFLKLVSQLQNFDDPRWTKKKWKSPKGDVEQAFLAKKAALDDRMITAYVKMGHTSFKYAESERYLDRAIAHFRRALELDGGPFDLDSKKQLVVGSTTIQPEPSQLLIERELIRIAGKLRFRDPLIRPLGTVSSLYEARSELSVVRSPHSQEVVDRMLPFLDSAVAEYMRLTGQRASRPIVLLVLPDDEAYKKYCDAANCEAYAQAGGFSYEAFGGAVTFEQMALEEVVIHEGAHAFHDALFPGDMPCWYDEGFANTFGAEGTWKKDGEKVRCGLPLSRNRLAALVGPGFIPLERILHLDAADLWRSGDISVPRYYAEAWALYTFLSTTTDPRFRQRFDDWESFTLSAGFVPPSGVSKAVEATKLFDRIFADVKSELEAALIEWIAAQAKTN